MSNRKLFTLSSLLVGLFLASCNATKHLAEGEKLYDEGKVVLRMDSNINADRKEAFEEHLEELLMPKPNKKFLGVRWGLGLWSMGGGYDTTRNLVKNWLKRRGEEPVLLSDVNREYNENLLRNRVENLGFFNASFSSDTTIDGRLATVTYTGIPRRIYRINAVNFAVDSTRQLGRDILKSRENSMLQTKRNYNLDVIISERERIDDDLKNKGYYYFNPDYLLVEVDSTVGDHQVDMYVTVKPETSELAQSPQRIGNIYIYPNYTLGAQGYSRRRAGNSAPLDSSYYFIDPENTFRKRVLANHIFFEKGELYNRNDHNLTLSHLVNLNAFKFVKNNFEPSPDEENTLDVYYYLTPLQKKTLRFEILAKTASVYNGTEANATWTLRNAFRGAETLSINIFGGYETQTGGGVNLNSAYYRYGAEGTISWPRLLAPYDWAPSRRFIPRTYLRVGYEFLNRRTAYVLNSSTINFGYQWKENDRKNHDLALAEIIYVRPSNISDAYQAQMDTVPTLRHIVEPQFSFGPNYVFTFTNTMQQELKHNFFFKGGLNTSANVLGLIQGTNYKEGNIRTLFDTPYSQFVKVDGDFRHYLNLGANRQLASRIMVGFSHSYGNSSSLPYLKQFYTGGPNGLRAFRARSVGPGSSMPENLGEDNFFADQTGDYKLEVNTEYRSKLAGFVHWAAFIDAGNIWVQNEENYKPGSGLSKDFLSELAVGGGLGLRFDFSFLILRTDFAIPFRVPYYAKGDRWTFDKIDLRSSSWRRDNLVFNLAIGYPF